MSINTQGEPTSYLCQINEYQRKMLMLAINAAIVYNPSLFLQKPGDIWSGPMDTMLQDLQNFKTMLEELPEHERKDPKVIHGLCL